MQQTRWAMVGTGLMLKLIGNDFRQTENVDLKVIVSRSQETADAAAAEYGISEGASNYAAVLDRDDIDVIYVAAPMSEHYDMAMAAIDAGKHVLVEKTMTSNATLTRQLCAAAEAKGVFCMEAMWTAFNPAIIEARRRATAGDLGEVNLVHANFSLRAPADLSHRLWRPELGGGSMLDQGVYTHSLAHFFLGAPSSISAKGTIEHGVDAEVASTLGYSHGARALLLNGLRAFSPMTAFVGGTESVIDFKSAFWSTTGFRHMKVKNPARVEIEEFSFEPEGGGYVPMLRAVSNAILEGKTEHELRTHAESIAVAETMDEVLRQVHAG